MAQKPKNKKKLRNITKAIQERTAQAISYPARTIYNRRGRKADADRRKLLDARKFRGAADFDSQGRPTAALQARTLADEVRQRRTSQARRKQSRY